MSVETFYQTVEAFINITNLQMVCVKYMLQFFGGDIIAIKGSDITAIFRTDIAIFRTDIIANPLTSFLTLPCTHSFHPSKTHQ